MGSGEWGEVIGNVLSFPSSSLGTHHVEAFQQRVPKLELGNESYEMNESPQTNSVINHAT